MVALFETHISGKPPEEVCRWSSYDTWHRVEAQGFQGDIWLLWNSYEIAVEIIQEKEQFITI